MEQRSAIKVAGVIPARYASTRFPGKPLADINGKSMIQRVYEQVIQALEHVYVATDDQRIFDAVQAFGGAAIMTREDHQSGTDRIAEAVEKIHAETDSQFDIIINIQGDEPFIQPSQILDLVDCFDEPMVDIATLIKPIEEEGVLFSSNSPKVVTGVDGRALYFSRSPIPYARNCGTKAWFEKHKYFKHIGIYGYRTEKLFEITKLPQSPLELAESLEQLRWLENGYTIQTAVTDFEGLAVDTPEDLEKVLKAMK